MNGKGDTPRPCDKHLYDTNYDNIFRKYVMEDTEHYDLDDADPVMIEFGTLQYPTFHGDRS